MQVTKKSRIFAWNFYFNFSLFSILYSLKLCESTNTDNTPEEAFEQAKAQQQAQEYYRQKGEGRPTKKDRRELDEFLDF